MNDQRRTLVHPSFAELLELLTVPDGNIPSGAYRVRAIPTVPQHFVGRNAASQPCLLLGGFPGRMHAPIRLAAIEARFGVVCRIHSDDNEAREEVLTVVTCTAAEPQLQSYFLHVCEIIVRIVGPAPSQGQVVGAVQRLVDLFQRLTRPSTRSVFGLIGELHLIACSRDPVVTAQAWRSADDDRFDFALGDVRLDVKASAERARVHHLSSEQCNPPAGTLGLLASVFVEPAGGGMSVNELIGAIESRLSGRDDLSMKVREVVAGTLGEALPTALAVRFDDQLALATIQFYDLATVPAIRTDIPSEVSQVRFKSNLSRTPSLAAVSIVGRSSIAAAFLPRPDL